MKKSNTGRNAALLASFAALALGGGCYLAQSRRAAVPATAAPSSSTPSSPTQQSEASPGPGPNDSILPEREVQPQREAGEQPHTIAVYTVTAGDDGARLTKKTLPASLTHGVTDAVAAEHALNAMAELKNSPLPPGTRVRSVKFGDDGVATVDFNTAFQKNFPGGDENEALTLNAVVATLGQFPGVKRVQFLVEGAKIDSLGGNQPLMEPLPVPQGGDAAQTTNPAVAKSEP